MQVCTSLQTDNHASTPPLSFLQGGCPSCRPTNSVRALKAVCSPIRGRVIRTFLQTAARAYWLATGVFVQLMCVTNTHTDRHTHTHTTLLFSVAIGQEEEKKEEEAMYRSYKNKYNSSIQCQECVALCKDISLQRGRFCTRSLASCIPRSSEDRSSGMFFIQVVLS